jgi:hypothetical protein
MMDTTFLWLGQAGIGFVEFLQEVMILRFTALQPAGVYVGITRSDIVNAYAAYH